METDNQYVLPRYGWSTSLLQPLQLSAQWSEKQSSVWLVQFIAEESRLEKLIEDMCVYIELQKIFFHFQRMKAISLVEQTFPNSIPHISQLVLSSIV